MPTRRALVVVIIALTAAYADDVLEWDASNGAWSSAKFWEYDSLPCAGDQVRFPLRDEPYRIEVNTAARVSEIRFTDSAEMVFKENGIITFTSHEEPQCVRFTSPLKGSLTDSRIALNWGVQGNVLRQELFVNGQTAIGAIPTLLNQTNLDVGDFTPPYKVELRVTPADGKERTISDTITLGSQEIDVEDTDAKASSGEGSELPIIPIAAGAGAALLLIIVIVLLKRKGKKETKEAQQEMTMASLDGDMSGGVSVNTQQYQIPGVNANAVGTVGEFLNADGKPDHRRTTAWDRPTSAAAAPVAGMANYDTPQLRTPGGQQLYDVIEGSAA
eukprot:m.40949 g.40949  ORF g.40949 m.40949 type:complete len:330 (+) comp12792_c0_seq2:140-1129(+)